MPFKHNAARRHRIPRRRGDLTFRIDDAALASWQAPRRTTPGGQPRCSDLAIELVPTVRLVLPLALRQAEAFPRSVPGLPGPGMAVPGHTTLSRRGRALAGRQPRVVRRDGPVHLVPDGTGLQLFGQGEWTAHRHGRPRRQWRRLHLAVDGGSGGIAARVLTGGHADDAAQAPALPGQAQGSVDTVTADGAHDSDAVCQAAFAREHGSPPEVVVPPRACAVRSTTGPAARTLRDRHIQVVAEQGRMRWQHATGYGRRSLVETAIGRIKPLIGPKLRARTLHGRQGEAALAVAVLNRMVRTAKPVSVRRT